MHRAVVVIVGMWHGRKERTANNTAERRRWCVPHVLLITDALRDFNIATAARLQQRLQLRLQLRI